MVASTAPAIGLLSPCGWGNLGDAAIQDSAIHGIRRSFPAARIQAFTLNPDDTEARHGVPAGTIVGYSIPGTYGVQPRRGPSNGPAAMSLSPTDAGFKERLRRFPGLFALLKAARRTLNPVEQTLGPFVSEGAHLRHSSSQVGHLDLLLASGGGQLDAEWGGAWGHPYALCRWSMLARLHGVPFGILSTGTGKVRTWLERWFLRSALEKAQYRSYRDEGSRTLALDFGAEPRDPVVPDLAFGVPVPTTPRTSRSGKRPLVGISPIVFERPTQWPVANADGYRGYTARLAQAVAQLVADGWDYEWLVSDLQDRHAVEEVRALVDADTAGHEVRPARPISGVADLLDVLSRLDLLIASRLHGLLLGFVMGIPAIALSYERKVDALMKDFDVTRYRLDIRTFTPADLLATVRRIHGERAAVAAGITRRAAAYRSAVDAQYDRVLTSLLGGVAP